jgi:hypothetical protein
MPENLEMELVAVREQLKTIFNCMDEMKEVQKATQAQLIKITETIYMWKGIAVGGVFVGGLAGSILTLVFRSGVRL